MDRKKHALCIDTGWWYNGFISLEEQEFTRKEDVHMIKISVQTGGLIETYGAEKTAKFISEAGFTGLDWGINRGWDRAAGEYFRSKIQK